MKVALSVGCLLIPCSLIAGGYGYASSAREVIATSSADTTTCADTLHASDTISAVVKISVRHQDTTAKLPPDFEGLFAQEFRSRFRPPPALILSVMHGDEPCDEVQHMCAAATPIVGVVAYAITATNGTVSQLGVVSASLNGELVDSVRSALTSMSKANMVPFFQAEKSLPLTIIVDAEERPDSIPPVRRLFRAKLPRYSIPFRHAQMLKNSPLPKYPRDAEVSGVGDTLNFRFTILPDGHVAPQSVDVLRAHYREFLRAVGDVLSKVVFHPAQLGGCPVAESVKQTFQFATR